MKLIFLVLLDLCSIITSDSRLIEKITDRTLSNETSSSSPPVRLTRQIDYDDPLTGISREDRFQSEEFVRSYHRRVKYYNKTKTGVRVIREPRAEEIRQVKPVKRMVTTTSVAPNKKSPPISVLIRKPIPKFDDVDYEEDFQLKVNRVPALVDSAEHEDEDFNVDDYDFDVNHDEFVSRGKPLEPRVKQGHGKKLIPKPAIPPEIKIKSKVTIVTQIRPSSIKKEHSGHLIKKEVEKEDYYDDMTTTSKAPTKNRYNEDDFGDENEESKESDSRVSTVRHVRSPWKGNAFLDKVGEKAVLTTSKILSFLPLFPQLPKNVNRRSNV